MEPVIPNKRIDHLILTKEEKRASLRSANRSTTNKTENSTPISVVILNANGVNVPIKICRMITD